MDGRAAPPAYTIHRCKFINTYMCRTTTQWPWITYTYFPMHVQIQMNCVLNFHEMITISLSLEFNQLYVYPAWFLDGKHGNITQAKVLAMYKGCPPSVGMRSWLILSTLSILYLPVV